MCGPDVGVVTVPGAYSACVHIRVEPVGPSRTAVVVVEPMDLSRFMACYDAVYAFLRGDTDVRQTGQNIALYQHGQRMEVGVEVDRSFPSAGVVVSSQLPGGRIAHATHTTGYGDLHKTYDAVRRWCDEHGHDTAGIQWEIYSDPANMITSTSRSVTCSPEPTPGDLHAAAPALCARPKV